MKIFTKLLLALALLAVYLTGYSANLAYGVTGDGVYIPENSSASHVEISATLNKGLSKKLNLPKRYTYSFTANSSESSTLGLGMLNTTMPWDEGRSKPTLSAYPNPTKGSIKVRLDQASDDNYKITFSNTIGRVIKIIKVPDSARDSEIKVDLSGLPAGLYFYSLLVNDKMVETKRLYIQ